MKQIDKRFPKLDFIPEVNAEDWIEPVLWGFAFGICFGSVVMILLLLSTNMGIA